MGALTSITEMGKNDLWLTQMHRCIGVLPMMSVEPVIGIIKEVLGFRQFSLRGLTKVAGEWNLVCLAFDVKRLHALQG
jgi:Transposase DDE domain